MKEKIDKTDLNKFKNFGSSKNTVKRIKRQAKDWEKNMCILTTNKELIFRLYKKLSKHNSKKRAQQNN